MYSLARVDWNVISVLTCQWSLVTVTFTHDNSRDLTATAWAKMFKIRECVKAIFMLDLHLSRSRKFFWDFQTQKMWQSSDCWKFPALFALSSRKVAEILFLFVFQLSPFPFCDLIKSRSGNKIFFYISVANCVAKGGEKTGKCCLGAWTDGFHYFPASNLSTHEMTQ